MQFRPGFKIIAIYCDVILHCTSTVRLLHSWVATLLCMHNMEPSSSCLHWMFCRSFINNRNSISSKMESFNSSLRWIFISQNYPGTLWRLPARKDSIHSSTFPLMPYVCNLYIRRLLGTVSKDLDKSRYIISVLSPSSVMTVLSCIILSSSFTTWLVREAGL